MAAARVERLAREFAEQRPAVAIIGGAPLAHTNGLFTALAVNALNALLGSVGRAGRLSFMPQAGAPASSASRSLSRPAAPRPPFAAGAAARRCQSGVRGAGGWKVREALAKIPFIASFGSFSTRPACSPI